ncbi:uncharacterized protein LOC141628694 [Silene latifolia]|uniref:uncharacterized protein LOC141628694 n=1 Tax=Silene latifolia TaxID=37657 RepID=UPI003D77C87D
MEELRKWKKDDWNNQGKGYFHKVEFLLVDEGKNFIQGLITKSLIKKYDGRIQEGKTYKIGRFQTIRNHGFNLATTHKCRIRFGTWTTIDEIEGGLIPKHGFKFVGYEDIISNKLEGRQLIDVIAGVDDYKAIFVHNNYKRMALDLGNQKLTARPGRSKGVVESKNKTILDDSCKTLHEIMCTELAGKYVTVAYLTEIDDTFGWYRNICQKCTSPVGKRHGKWYCSDESCIAHEEGSEDRATRFLINDDSGVKANLIMYDKQIKKKVAKTPLECLDKLKQQGDVLGVPQELTSMLQKKYVLKLIVDKRYNLELSSRCYTIVDYSDDLRHIEAWTKQYKMIEEMSAATSETPDSMGCLLEKIQYENQIFLNNSFIYDYHYLKYM